MIHDDPAFLAWASSRRRHFVAAKARAIARLAAVEITPAFEYEAWCKARRGWAEHDGGIRHMTPGEVDAMAREEVLDLMWYEADLAAREARG